MVKRNGFQARKKCNLGSLVWTFLFMPTALDGATVVRSWTSSLDMTSYGGSAGDDKGKNTAGPKPSLFTSDQLSMFDRDGFLIVSGLLEHEIAELTTAGDAYVRASKKMKAYFSSIEMGMIFQAGMMANDTTTSAFRHVALDSILPRATAELMRLSADSNVRILRDIFISKAVDQDAVCDWHVDDVGFWPESYDNEHDGINVWIAMQDMPAFAQGSMALAPGSHKADWRFDAYEAIGQNRTYHGGFTKMEMKQRARAGEKLLTTCEMRNQAPDISQNIEETAFIPDIKTGDVIFMTRALFHRTAAATPDGKNFFASHGIDYLNRYSVRYVPGTARLPQGWTFEWGIVANEENAGRSLDEAMEQDSLLWYPQVWPTSDNDRDARLTEIAKTKLDEVKSKTRLELFELISLFAPNRP